MKSAKMQNKYVFNFLKIFAFCLFLLAQSSLFAQSSWDGGGDGSSWNDGANWNPEGIPDGADAVTINATADVTLSGTDGVCASLILTGADTLTVADGITLDVGGDVTINAAGSMLVLAGSALLELEGDWTNNGTFTANSSSVTFDGSTSSSINDATTFYDLIVSKGSSTDAVSAPSSITVTVNNELTISTGTLATSTSGLAIQGSGTGSQTITMENANCVLNILGTATFPSGFETATLNSTSQVNYNGALQTVAYQESDGGTLTYGRLGLSGTDTKTAGGALDVNGNFTLSSVLFIMSNFSHEFGGDWTTVSGSISMGPTVTITFDGAIQTITENVSGNFGHIEFSGGGRATLGATLTGIQDLTVSNNTILDSDGNNITVTGDWSIESGSSYEHNNNTVTFNLTGAQDIASSTFYNITFSGSGTKTATGALTITNSVIIQTGVTFDGGTYTHRVINDWTFQGTGTFASTGTVEFGGTVLSDINGTPTGNTFNNIVVARNRVRIGNGDDVSLSGDVTINSGAYLRIDGTGDFTCNDLEVSGALEIYGSVSFPTISGTVTYNHPTEAGGRVDYYDNTAQTISALVSGCYDLLVRSGNSTTLTKSAAGDLVVYDDLEVGQNNGTEETTLDMGSFSLTVGDGINVNTNDVLESAGTITLNTLATENGTITLADVGATIDANNLTFTLQDNPTLSREVDINITGAGALLTVGGDLTINNPTGTSSLLYEIELGPTIFATTGTNTLTMNDYCWISTDGATNFEDMVDEFESVSFSSNSGIAYLGGGAQTLASTYNSGGNSLTYQNLVIDNGTAKNVEGALDINGTFLGTGDAEFNDGGQAHTVAGDYAIESAAGTMTGSITFDGTDQTISNNHFNDVTFSGSGTKEDGQVSMIVPATGGVQTLNVAAGTWDFDGDVTINNVMVDADLFAVQAAGDWLNESGGTFLHDQTMTLNGTTAQDISGQFNNITISNTSGTINANNTVEVEGNLTFNANTALNDNGNDIYIEGNWTRNATGTAFVSTGTTYFDGLGTQDLYLAGGGATIGSFNNIVFSGSGSKDINNVGLTVAGDFTIGAGVTVEARGYSHSVAGNWINNGGSLNSTGTITFNGGTQDISAESGFNNLVIAGTNSMKTLSGNIGCAGDLTINATDTLDVSVNNYNVEVRDEWTNNGGFDARAGTVTFTGTNAQDITSNGTGDYNNFYNITVNKSSSYVRLLDDMDIDNNLSIISGTFNTNTYDLWIGAGLSNAGIFTHNAASRIEFNATTGTPAIDVGASIFTGVVEFDATGATYQFNADATFGDSLIVTNGTIQVNDQTVTVNDILEVNGGTFDVNNQSQLQIASGAEVSVGSSGTIQVVGDASNTAVVTRSGTSGTYTFSVDGEIGAQYYLFEHMDASGIQVNSGADVNATNDFSNGTFSNGTSGGRFLLYEGTPLGAAAGTDSIYNTVFNSGPTYNVRRTSGDEIVFKNASGTLAGETNDDDGGTFITWYREGATWNGTISTDWNTAANWTPNTGTPPLPGENATIPSGSLTNEPVIGTGDTATCNNLFLDGNTLTISGSGLLSTSGNITINSGATFSAANQVTVNGSFLNGGTFTANSSELFFDASSGTYSINTGGDFVYDITFDGPASWTLQADLDVNGDFTNDSASVDVSSSNYDINCAGDWSNSGTFNYRAAEVIFDGTAQAVTGTNNAFYDLTFNNSGTKTFSANVDINNNVRFGGESVTLNAGTYNMYVGGDWLITGGGTTQFVSSGSGTVYFNSENVHQDIVAISSFNNVVFSGTQRKEINGSMQVNGDLTISITPAAGTDIVDINLNSVTGVGASNTLTMHPNTDLRIGGSNFPTGFETVNLDPTSDVRYGGVVGTFTIETNSGTINYGILTLQTNGSTYQPNGDLLARTINMGAGILLDMDGLGLYDLTISTFLDVEANSLDADNSTVTFNENNGTGFTIDANLNDLGGVQNLVISGSGTKNLLGSLTVLNDVTIDAGATLDINANTLDGSGGSNELSMGSAGRLMVAGDFPTNFETVSLDANSTVEYDGTGAQDVVGGFNYGNLEFDNGTADPDTAQAALNIDGDFILQSDAGFVGGNFIHTIAGDFTQNGTFDFTDNTITFDGSDQNLVTNDPALEFNNVNFNGTGTKYSPGDNFDVDGNLSIASGVTLDINDENMNLAGELDADGTYSQTGGTTTFDGADQLINPGNGTFYTVVMSGTGTKTFNTSGMDVNNNFTINAGVTVDFSTFTHNYANDWTNIGNEISTSGTFLFDGTVEQDITVGATDTLNNLQLTNSSNKDINTNPLVLTGDFTIGSGANLRTNGNDITLAGSFSNSGTIAIGTTELTFNATTGPRTIATNNVILNDVTLDATGVTYTLTDASNRIYGNLDIQAGTFDFNGNDLTFGNASADQITVASGGTLEIDASATLNMDNGTDITGASGSTIRVVGTEGSPATVSVITTTSDRYGFTASGTMEARYYQFEYMDATGIEVESGASLHATNNFSDGSFSNGASGGRYFKLANTLGSPVTMDNVSFNAGADTNIYRPTGTGGSIVTFDNYTGSVSGAAYENDPDNLVTWSTPGEITWTGNQDNNWNDGDNWFGGSIPTIDDDCIIPASASVQPRVTAADASCRSIRLESGASLVIENNYDLTIGIGGFIDSGTVVITGTDTVNCAGNWSILGSGSFSPGTNSTVVLNGSGGSQVVTMPSHSFNNLNVNGTSTVQLAGALDINGDFNLALGATFDVVNYNITASGDWTDNGSFTYQNDRVTFDGAGTITNGNFYDLYIDAGSNTVTTSGTTTVADNFVITTGTVTAGGPIDANSGADANDAVSCWDIASGATFNDGGYTHTCFGGIKNNGTFAGTGTIRFDGGSENPVTNACTLTNVEIAGTGTKTIGGNLTLNNLTISSGYFNVDGSYTVNAAGGSDILTIAASARFYLASSMSGFESYNLDPTSYVFYDGADQTIVSGPSYGNLYMNGSGSVKTAGGNLDVDGLLYFYAGVTLDMDVSNNYTLNLAGNWDNDNAGGGTFLPRLGTVILDGSGIQNIFSMSDDTSKAFYKLTVNRSSTNFVEFQDNIRILNNFRITDGIVDLNNNTLYIGSNFINSDSLIVRGASTTYFVPQSGSSVSITTDGSAFDNAIFNSTSTTFTMQDNLIVRDNLTLSNGTLDMNGNNAYLGQNGGGVESHSINGTLDVDANSSLLLSSNSNLTVNSGGTIHVVGTPGNVATVTRQSTGSYGFAVNGTIHARYYLFEYMNSSGIVVNSGATFDASNNFSDGTFTNGQSGGILFRIENTQTDTLNNVAFPSNPGGGAVNVAKITSASGEITFDNVSGEFSGEAFDNDPNDLIIWPESVILTWDGSAGTDWNTAANWTPSSGPEQVPDSSTIAIIASTVNQPVISSGNDGRCAQLSVNSGAILTLNGRNLDVDGDITITGTLTISNSTDTVWAGGAWTRSGTFNNGSSIVVFDANNGVRDITNGAFNDVTFDGNATFLLASNMTVADDFTILNGTFDVSTSNRALSVGGDWSNSGTFTPRNGTVTLNASSGTIPVNTGGTANAFNNLIVNASSVTYQLVTNNMAVNGDMTISAGTFDLNGRVLDFGDGSGDNLTISGTLLVDENASLRMGASTALAVNSGGTISILGTGESNIAAVTRRSTGTYGFSVNGNISARYYLFEFMNTNGIQINSNATVNATNNFSDGTFSNGAASGRYLLYAGSAAGAIGNVDSVRNVTFNSGPAVNVRRVAGTDTIVFNDAAGVLAGVTYEDDSPDGSATTGFLRWVSSSTIVTWLTTGTNAWNLGSNWDSGNPPTANQSAIIPSGGTQPTISTRDAVCTNVTVQSGAIVTLANGTLDVGEDVTLAGNITSTGDDTVEVAGSWLASGTFTSGTNSLVIFDAATGTETINSNGQSFYNLECNGSAIFRLVSALDVDGDLTITSGTLDVNSTGNYAVSVAGDMSNSGTFQAQSGTVTFNGSGAQALTSGGLSFNNIVINKSNTLSLNDALDVNNNLTVSAGTVSNVTNTVNLAGAWQNTGGTFTAGSGLVTFDGSGNVNIRTNGSSFNSLTINKGASGSVSSDDNVDVNGTLTVTSGVFYANGRTLSVGDDGADLVSITGTLDVDAGAELQLFNNTTSTVNSNGLLRLVGSGASNRALMTRLGSGNYAFNVNGQIAARYATIEYTQGNGIQVNSGGTIAADNDFDNCIFQNGIGTAYLTVANAQNLTMTGVQFDSAATTRNTYNVNYTGTGQIQQRNYSGTMAGAHYENDNGSGFFGNVLWDFSQVENINNSTETFGNDVVITTTDNLGNVTVDLVDELLSTAPATVARYYEVTPTNAGTGTVRLSYSDDELNNEAESDLRVWQLSGGLWTRIDGSVNTSANYVEVSGYGFSGGVMDTLVLSDALVDNSLPVELVLFESKQFEGNVELFWKTASEVDNAYFIVERSENAEDGFIEIGRLRGQGTTSHETEYSFVDEDVRVGDNYYYRLADYDYVGRTSYSDVIFVEIVAPKDFVLSQNYPNPFNPVTHIKMQLPEMSNIVLSVYNMRGQKVSQLAKGDFEAGFYEFQWNARNDQGNNVASGMYIYVMQAKSLESNKTKRMIKKMILLH